MKEDFAINVRRTLKVLDPKGNFNEKEGIAAQLLFASVTHGTNVNELSKEFEFPLDVVNAISGRFWENGIWDACGVDPDAENDYLTFCMMCLCGEGTMKRQFNKSKNDWEYQMTQAGRDHVESLLRK